MNDPSEPVGFVTAVSRALLLRCPRCGSENVLEGWFKLRERCGVCALGLRRAPDSDEWFGGYFINLIISQLLMLVVVIGYVIYSWPVVPWNTVEVLTIGMIFISSIVSYPFSKLVWIAVELVSTKRE